jgi:ribonuclease BN (tRNA processing enzyme)
MKIKFLGAHNSESLDARCVTLVIDGVVAVDAGALTSSLSLSEQKELKSVLLTYHHYDHIHDVPLLALNLFFNGGNIEISCPATAREVILSHMLNGLVYPRYSELPERKPVVSFRDVTPDQTLAVADYRLLAVRANHTETTLGYQITDKAGSSVYYTADTGPGISAQWRGISPQLLISDVTKPDRFGNFAVKSGHMTPSLLGKELVAFREMHDYLSRVVAIHMDPALQPEIERELSVLAGQLQTPIDIACEGMEITI